MAAALAFSGSFVKKRKGEIGETIKFMTALTFKHVPFKTVSYPRDPAGLKLPKFFSRL